MDEYRPPLPAISLALGAAGLTDELALPPFGSLSADDVSGVLDGFGRFAAEVLAPTDRIGDREGVDFDPATGAVTTPAAIRDAFERWVADGWAGLTAPREHGGGGFPTLVGVAAEEMFVAANLALSLNPMLTRSAVHVLAVRGTAEQQAVYLPRLVSGEWTGTMNLTEPDAGSDVGAVRTRAVPTDDGSGRWEVTGTKIFITWGEHDVAGNIVHLVLARTPGAPAGTKGLSLFLVPRNLVSSDGTVGERNRVRCTGIERKLGIHASPTCVLDFDSAVGELVGPEQGGMAAMFLMMNTARLSIGLEGLAVSERAYQQALAYARERRQGQAPSPALPGSAGSPAPPGSAGSAGSAASAVSSASAEAGDGPSPIIDHPDVRRMLLVMASGIDAMRVLLYTTAAATDTARHHPDPAVRSAAAARADLLTPLAKAWPTDEGVRLTSVAIQVHGGVGYVEETGIAQRYRDARIAPIYEGTNGIQAIDLVGRKVRRDRGEAMHALVTELASGLASIDPLDGLEHARAALDAVRKAADWLIDARSDEDWLAAATPYLELVSLSVCCGLFARQVAWARQHATPAEAAALAGRFTFFALERLAQAPSLFDPIATGATRLSPTYRP